MKKSRPPARPRTPCPTTTNGGPGAGGGGAVTAAGTGAVEGGAPNNLNTIYRPVGITVRLRYGHEYEFRVRLRDLSGGGAKHNEHPAIESPSGKTSCHFKRYVCPNRPRIADLPLNSDGASDPESLSIQRPLLGYPAVVYTGKYGEDAVAFANSVLLNSSRRHSPKQSLYYRPFHSQPFTRSTAKVGSAVAYADPGATPDSTTAMTESMSFGAETRRLAGPARIREDLAGVSFLISPTAFFQTNVRAAEQLVGLVLAAIPEGSTVLDLYAGAGLFALPLAKRGHAVVAIEGNRIASADGIASRELSRIPEERCRFITAAVERALGVEARPRAGKGRARAMRVSSADAVVLDPPREGCSRAVLNAVFGRLTPRIAVYVSCNPETLARDLAIIARHGYAIRSIQPVDMFPHTPHIEAVVVVERTEDTPSFT